MALPVNARIQAAQSFVLHVRAAREFMLSHDESRAEREYLKLLDRLAEAREHLRWTPAAGRPARFLQAQSSQAQRMATGAIGLAASHGVPELRELIVKPYVVLYAHGEDRVVLLALKHERQLVFNLGG